MKLRASNGSTTSYLETNAHLRSTSLISQRHGTQNRVYADGAHDTGTDTLGWSLAENAYGGRALELLFYSSQVLHGRLGPSGFGWGWVAALREGMSRQKASVVVACVVLEALCRDC